MAGWFDAEETLNAAQGRWLEVLGKLQVNVDLLRPRHGPCPGCGGRDRFRFDDQNGQGSFICSQGGAGNLAGNGIALLQHVHGWEWKRCIEEVGRIVLGEGRRRGGGVAGGRAAAERVPAGPVLPAVPTGDEVGIPKYDEGALRRYVEPIGRVTIDGLKRLSPIPVHTATADQFIDVLYGTGERVLVFTEFYSQGDFLHEVGRGSFRLAKERGIRAVPSPLPDRARCGVWFLCNPVTGAWDVTESKQVRESLPRDVCGPPAMVVRPAKWGRRSWRTVTSWRYAVLESDCAPEELWLKALIKLPVPIVAIYSSGGKSLHALLRIDAGDKLMWDLIVRGKNAHTATRSAALMDLVCPLGADAAALTGVRLTRLPFCLREGMNGKSGYVRYERPRLQELVYLANAPLNRRLRWVSLEQRHLGGKFD